MCDNIHKDRDDCLTLSKHIPKPSPRPSRRNYYFKTNDLSNCNQKNSYNLIKFSSNNHISSLPENIKISNAQKKDKGGVSGNKKRSWYSNVFFPTYKSRFMDFKKIFKDIPSEERLIVDYSCALQREILVHGRLYVSQNFANFYANIFMWETVVSIPWKDVISISKEKTALVIPNAILISTSSNKFFFTSFGSRDKTYMMLLKIWRNALLEQPVDVTEIWKLIRDCYGEQLGFSDDEEYIAKTISHEHQTIPVSSDKKARNSISSLITKDNEFINFHPNDSDTSSESETESLIEEKQDIITRPLECTELHNGRSMLKINIALDADKLFSLLFTNTKFLQDFQTTRKTTNLVQTTWNLDTKTEKKVRTVSYTMALNQTIGPKYCQVTETQTMSPCSEPGYLYSINIESTNSGIPYANAFVVLTHYCIKNYTETHSTIEVYCDIKYTKNVWGLVRKKNCWAGMDDYFNCLKEALHLESLDIPIKKENQENIKNKQIKKSDSIPENPLIEHSTENKSIVYKPSNISRVMTDIQQNTNLTWVLLVTVIILLVINGILCYRLWKVDEMPYVMDFHVLKHTPKTDEDWISLLQQQESLHNIEMKKWQRILHTTVQLLKQTEESLTQLQMSTHPTATEKLFSVLKSGYTDLRDQPNNEDL